MFFALGGWKFLVDGFLECSVFGRCAKRFDSVSTSPTNQWAGLWVGRL
jgi:hypothetical protein